MQNKELEKRLSGIKYQDKEERGYERDMARILHSYSFRSLQNKMQVFFLGDSDYCRTRLTHISRSNENYKSDCYISLV